MSDPVMNFIPAPPTTDLLQPGDPVTNSIGSMLGTERFGIVVSVEMNGEQQRAKVMWANAVHLDLVISSALTKVQDPYIRIGELESQVTALMSDGANAARAVGELQARLKESRDDVDYLEGRRNKLLRKVKKLKKAAPKRSMLRKMRVDAAWAASGDLTKAEAITNYALHGLPEKKAEPFLYEHKPGFSVVKIEPGERYEPTAPTRFRDETAKTEVIIVGQIRAKNERLTHYLTDKGIRVPRRDVEGHFTFIRKES